jgi:uncharacterized LabA/DUF88 family protein
VPGKPQIDGKAADLQPRSSFVSKNVAVFVDVANIFYAAKAAGADIDYVTLLKAAVAGRDFVRAYAYTGLDPENENQRNFHNFLARHGYKVVSKDIRKYGDGKVKANLDIELVVDMMKTARNLDVAIIVSGDGDFAPAIRAVQEMGVRVEVISFRGNTSSDLIEVADAFYDITQLARVERESSRSGRRVATDDEDLSMTEVPDKQTEGRGGRGRGRGRGRGGRDGYDEPLAAVERSERVSGRGAARPAARSSGRLLVLPGEKLSRAADAGDPALGEAPIGDELPEEMLEGEALDLEAGEAGETGEAAGRRRRRRGGRGRGHGRTREAGDIVAGDGEPVEAPEGELPAAPAPRPNQFGSVWDSQIGMVGRPARQERVAPVTPEEDDYAEPEIPEYLLAERRRGGGGGGGGRGGSGGRGVRSAYASAVERERYGRGASSSRYPEPARPVQQPRRRDERPPRQGGLGPQRGGGMPRGGGLPRGGNTGRDASEPWSEVPPELEELLRAQLSTKLSRPAAASSESSSQPAEATEAAGEAQAKPKATRSRRKPADDGAETATVDAAVDATGDAAGEAPAKPKVTRSRRKRADDGAENAAGEATADAAGEAPAPKKRAPRRKATAEGSEAAGGEPAGE